MVIPYYVGTLLAGKLGGSPLTVPTFVYEFGVLFTVLEVCAAFFDGMAVSVPFVSGVAILSAVYIWLVTNGGSLSLAAGGITMALDIRVLMYFVVVPSIWAAVRAPVAYAVWRRALRGEPLAEAAPAP